MWRDKLPASTTKEYVLVIKALNKRELLDEDVFYPIAEVLEIPMEKKEFQNRFKTFRG